MKLKPVVALGRSGKPGVRSAVVSALQHYHTAGPTLISPANNSVTSDNTPAYDWNDVSSAVEYNVRVLNATSMSEVLNRYTTASEYVPPILPPFDDPLVVGQDEQEFVWQVRYRESSSPWGSWGSLGRFTINTYYLDPPNRVSPSEGAVLNDPTASCGAPRYSQQAKAKGNILMCRPCGHPFE